MCYIKKTALPVETVKKQPVADDPQVFGSWQQPAPSFTESAPEYLQDLLLNIGEQNTQKNIGIENYLNFIDLGAAMTAGFNPDFSIPSLGNPASPSTNFTNSPPAYGQQHLQSALLASTPASLGHMPRYSVDTSSSISAPVYKKRAVSTESKSDDNEDLDEVTIKRKRNTEAARRSRQRKLAKLENLEGEVHKLEGEKRELGVEVAVLRNERDNYIKREREMQLRILALEQQLQEAHRMLLAKQ